MPLAIKSLPVARLDYTKRGPGLHIGLTQLRAMLDADGGRNGYALVEVAVPGAVIPIVMRRSDLYVIGFRCAGKWFRFDDAHWPFPEPVTELGYEGQYGSLGGLSGSITERAVADIAQLATISHRSQWKEPLRTLLVIVSECSRLIPVQMEILGLLNGISPAVPLAPLSHYMKNWSKASKGTDMSQEAGPNLRVGFRDPTIIKR